MKFSDAVCPAFLVEVDDDFRIGASTKAMAALQKLGAQGVEVVNLAVQDDHDGAIFIEDRLRPRGQVDDAQPPVPQRGTTV